MFLSLKIRERQPKAKGKLPYTTLHHTNVTLICLDYFLEKYIQIWLKILKHEKRSTVHKKFKYFTPAPDEAHQQQKQNLKKKFLHN